MGDDLVEGGEVDRRAVVGEPRGRVAETALELLAADLDVESEDAWPVKLRFVVEAGGVVLDEGGERPAALRADEEEPLAPARRRSARRLVGADDGDLGLRSAMSSALGTGPATATWSTAPQCVSVASSSGK
nr:hypothetical protein [Micromonospora deserti]